MKSAGDRARKGRLLYRMEARLAEKPVRLGHHRFRCCRQKSAGWQVHLEFSGFVVVGSLPTLQIADIRQALGLNVRLTISLIATRNCWSLHRPCIDRWQTSLQ